VEQPEENRRQQGRAERTMTILESSEPEAGPSDLLGDTVQENHDRQRRQECGEQQQPIPGESAQWAEAIQDGDSDQQDQQSGEQANQIPAQRHPPSKAAPSQIAHP
jgi:hypothetical protein